MANIKRNESTAMYDRSTLGRSVRPTGWPIASLAALAWLVAGCGGEQEVDQPATSAIQAAQQAADQVADRTEQIAQQAAQVGEVDAELAASGEEAFRSRGCIACHTVGGARLVGPDLLGVTDRRTPGWIRAMIMNPDSMIKNDPDAKKLFEEYFTPMSNQQVTSEQAAAIFEFLRRESADG
jgi:mono/diheme cytochrome c family protein